jgi:hypothetical protein
MAESQNHQHSQNLALTKETLITKLVLPQWVRGACDTWGQSTLCAAVQGVLRVGNAKKVGFGNGMCQKVDLKRTWNER